MENMIIDEGYDITKNEKSNFTAEQIEIIKKYHVIVLHAENFSNKSIAKKLDMYTAQVSRLIKKFYEHNDVLFKSNTTNIGGHNKKLNTPHKNFILNKLDEFPKTTQKKLVEELNTEFKIKTSISTVSRYLKTMGDYKNPKMAPVISEKNKIKRYDYATYHKNDMFSNVVFSDETYFELNKYTKKIFVLHGEESDYKNKFNNPNFKIGVWAAISKKGKIGFTFLDQNVDKFYYIEILKNHLLEKANSTFGLNKWRFQQDNAPSHKAVLVKEWLEENTPKKLNHPPQSPDLNPIELIWPWMKKEVENKSPQNKEQLKFYIEESWKKLTTKQIIRTIDHLRGVIQDVILKNGEFIG